MRIFVAVFESTPLASLSARFHPRNRRAFPAPDGADCRLLRHRTGDDSSHGNLLSPHYALRASSQSLHSPLYSRFSMLLALLTLATALSRRLRPLSPPLSPRFRFTSESGLSIFSGSISLGLTCAQPRQSGNSRLPSAYCLPPPSLSPAKPHPAPLLGSIGPRRLDCRRAVAHSASPRRLVP